MSEIAFSYQIKPMSHFCVCFKEKKLGSLIQENFKLNHFAVISSYTAYIVRKLPSCCIYTDMFVKKLYAPWAYINFAWFSSFLLWSGPND